MKLFLDLDDTVFDTENYLRASLGGSWLGYEGLVYAGYGEMNSREINRVFNIFSDYSKIPFIKGAMEGIKLLKEKYEVIFCSCYCTLFEKFAKKKFADSLGIPIILCNVSEGKSGVDMSGGVFVDDFSVNLNESNADVKICFYKRFNLVGEFKSGKIVFDWDELLKELL